MTGRHRLSIVLPLLSCILLAGILNACGSDSTATPKSTTANGKGKTVTMGLGYIPDIQFAPFYVAESKGYYSAVGLNVVLHHGQVSDLIGSMAAGKNDFVFAGGDELLQAHDKGVNALDVGTVFQKYPVSLIVPKDSPIKQLSDLKGRTIGVPGAYGSTYIGLLALLYKAGLPLSAVKIQTIGYTQVAALIGHRVDAVMGYTNNEPLQLNKKGFPVRTFDVADNQPLISNGIIVPVDTYQKQSQMVNNFVQATLKGVKAVLADPGGAVTISKAYVPGMNVEQATEVLRATLPIYQSGGPLGYNDPPTWKSMAQFMVDQKLISTLPDVTKIYTNQAIAQS